MNDLDFTIGRNDFSVTVYVPWNCNNNCKFCSSKEDYEKIKSDFPKLKESLQLIRESILPIVVFTGGEPSADVEKLRELVSIVDNKIVYINTTLPYKNCGTFIKFVNDTPCVKGISISRHKYNYGDDCKILHNIADDDIITLIQKPVRINVVEDGEDPFSPFKIERYVARWEKIAKLKGGPKSLILNLRSNYCLQDRHYLHEMTDCKVINDLASKYYYSAHNFCNVCDTCTFEKLDENKNTELVILYHRGVMHTAIKFANIVEVNDLIILQNGDICYDWDGKKEQIETFLDMIKPN